MSNINNKDNSGENARGPSSGGAAGAPAASSGGSGGAVAIAAKKVCFICGSYTSQTINIFEPRDGPNIIELINEKFKVPVSVDALRRVVLILLRAVDVI